jgi:hypothetical protein
MTEGPLFRDAERLQSNGPRDALKTLEQREVEMKKVLMAFVSAVLVLGFGYTATAIHELDAAGTVVVDPDADAAKPNNGYVPASGQVDVCIDCHK